MVYVEENIANHVVKAAQLTVAFVILYKICMMNILRMKIQCINNVNKQRQRGEKEAQQFDRYSSPAMHTADRLVGNFLEWYPMFIGLVWSLALTGNLNTTCYVASWLYVILRGLYIVLILQYGVATNGINTSLAISTIPSYICLIIMCCEAIRQLYM